MSGNGKMNGNDLKGTTEVMKPVNVDASADAKSYSYKNTQKKATRKEKKATKERLTKVDETQSVNSASGRKSPTPVMASKQTKAKHEGATPQADADAIAQAALQAKDPNRKFFIIGCALIAFGMIMFVCIAAFGFPYFYNQGATTANELNAAKTSTYKDTTDTNSSNANSSTTEKKEEAKTETTTAAETTCQHEWEEVRQTIHHDPVTHEVNHEAEYRTVTRYHTVCNVCDEKIDNQIAEHKEKTGHYSWSTNVPFQEQQLVADAYTQTVTDQEAWDEQIVMGRKCKKCGKAELYD